MKVIPSTCCHDCGGSCPLNIYVKDGRIIKIETHDVGLPAMRPCLRGLLYHYRVYASDRLKYPMKRIGKRGEGKFTRIPWDEALDEVAEQTIRIRDTYGPAAILMLPGSGFVGRLNNVEANLRRLLNMAGGYSGVWGVPSNHGARFASLATYGTLHTGSERADLLNSKMIILWGCNPAESIFGTDTRWYLTQAKEKGTKIICIDPRFTESAATWVSSWIPIKPGTDTAMLVAMSYVIIEHGLQDQHFLNTYTIGFDKFRDYIVGAEDNVPKTPKWAETITGVPEETIEALALEYATTKPAAIISGWAPGRTAMGEQYHRATATLSAITGNIGIHGGATACLDRNVSALPPTEEELTSEITYSDLPSPMNPVSKDAPPHDYAVKGIWDLTTDKTHNTKVWDKILRGKAGGYFADTKMVYIASGNAANQFCDTNKAVEALQKPEFIVVHDQFMTLSARFADILLPVCTWCELNDIKLPWGSGFYALYVNKAIEPMYESKTDLDIFTQLAVKMGISGYNDKTDDEWLRLLAAKYGIPNYDTFKASGFYKLETDKPYVAFQNQIIDPARYPFPTPSGKIEIFCQRIADSQRPDVLPPIPKYIEGLEGPTDPKRHYYPLQLITPHSRRRNHSQFHNIPWYRELEPHEVWINPTDAQTRDIKNHDKVKVFNDRGAITLLAKLTNRIMPGIVSIYQGTWHVPTSSGLEQGGCANVLTPGEHSPGGAFCSNTVLIQVEKV